MSDGIKPLLEQFIRELQSTLQTRMIYGPTHHLTKEAIDKVYAKLLLVLEGRQEITLGIIGTEIAFEKEPLYEVSRNASNLVAHFKELTIEKISFEAGISVDECAAFVALCASTAKEIVQSGGIEKTAAVSGLTHVVFGKIGYSKDEAQDEHDDALQLAKGGYQSGLSFLQEAFQDIQNNRPINVKAARVFASSIITNLMKNKYSLLILTSTKTHDEYTFVHAINVSIFTVVQAESLGIRQDLLSDIGVAGLLHDTGKLVLSGEVLRKKGKLDPKEFEMVRSHPVDGARLLVQTPDTHPLSSIGAFEHHLRYSLKGYPERLFGGPPNLVSYLIAIADVYDALRSKRAYHEEMAPETTYEEMRKMSGDYFHPDLLENFFHVIGMYPPGTLVELTDKRVGMVVRESALDIRRPQVEILYDSNSEKVGQNYIVNLMEKDPATQEFRWSVSRSIIPSPRFEIPEKYKA
ncbi:MAG TPA: HD domain-containing protein [Candidatus Omnitrophota bacterium]|nr:HD domain-containing protein [Candidatus Omnitrophota bacterium]HPT07825.1 HD domain-containing protein [Candidatus Omnitrophota bacterium]